jgi:hypothetical protein
MVFGGQLAFYAVALGGMATDRFSGVKILQIPRYFLAVNASIAVAWWRYLGMTGWFSGTSER